MTGPPPPIAARRARQRAQRRRRRRAWLAVAVAIVAAAVAVPIALGGGGAHGRPRAGRAYVAAAGAVSARGRAGGSYPAPPGRSRSATAARAQAAIHRLLALGLPVLCGGHRGDEVAFTFDDGPGIYTHYALKKLAQAHARATFFVVGKSIIGWPGWLPRELRVGALGDHTYTHPDLLGLSLAEARSQLQQTAQLIRARSGARVDLWRPPYGASSPAIEGMAAKLGLLEIRWSVDSMDWAGADWTQIVRIVETGLRAGGIVLMHENHGQTIRALTALLPWLRRQHLRPVTVPELLASDPPTPGQLRRGLTGCEEPASLLRAGARAGG